MIKDVGGRQISVRTQEEELKLLEQDMAELSPAERELLELAIREMQEGQEGESVLDLASKAEYEREAVDIRTWLEDDYFFGEITRGLYPKLKSDLVELFSGDYHEIVLSGSIGWGKTTFADIAMARQIYELSCLRNPQRSLGLASGSELVFAGISINEKVAQKTIFEGIAQKLQISPYFQKEFKPKETQDSITFPKNIQVIPASAADNSLIGRNVVGATIDESNFMEFSAQQRAAHARWGQVDKAGRLYSGLLRRMKSRFLRGGKLPGMLLVVSSKKNSNSFTERKVKESIDNPRIFVREYALWDVKKFSDKKFRVLVGTEDASSQILDDDVPLPSSVAEGRQRVIEVPVDFRDDFENDLDGSLRDIAGIATDSIRPFFSDREKVAAAFTTARVHPANDFDWNPSRPHGINWDLLCVSEVRKRLDGTTYLKWKPRVNPTALRHLHIDPSLKNDATGFAMAHISEMREVIRSDHVHGQRFKEHLPAFWTDLLMRIIPPERGREIPLAAIRQLIYELTAHGFKIGLITMDSYQSADMRQTLVTKGYNAKILSVDIEPAPYEMLREAINQGRLNSYRFPILEREIRQVEWYPDKKKVDHPPDGSKDIADALAGVTYSLRNFANQRPDGLVATHGISEAPTEDYGNLAWVLPKNSKGEPLQPRDPPSHTAGWEPLLPLKG